MSELACYGNYNKNKPDCKVCEYADYCKEAADPAPSAHTSYEDISYSEEFATSSDNILDKLEPTEKKETAQYSQSQLLELLACVINIEDRETRYIVRSKVQNPDISYSQIGKRFGITKQAVHNKVNVAISFWPELEIILKNRPLYNKNRYKKAIPRKKYKPQKERTAIQLKFKF